MLVKVWDRDLSARELVSSEAKKKPWLEPRLRADPEVFRL
jgi:hypothetical protein